MYYILLVLFCGIAQVLCAKPAIPLQLCKTDDVVCVTNAVKAAYPVILEPNKEIGADEMDPMFQDVIEGNLSVLKFKMTNTTIIGYKTCEVQMAKFLENNEEELRIELLCPKFIVKGTYEIKGKLLALPVEGNGEYTLDANKYSIIVDLHLKTIMKDGKTYKNIKSFTVKAEPLEKVEFDFKNLFNGRKDLADAVITFANQNWKEVANEVQEPVFLANLKLVVKNANRYLKTISVEEYTAQ